MNAGTQLEDSGRKPHDIPLSRTDAHYHGISMGKCQIPFMDILHVQSATSAHDKQKIQSNLNCLLYYQDSVIVKVQLVGDVPHFPAKK